MPRGIYDRSKAKKKVVQDYANPIQVLADEVVALKKKAMTAKPSKRMILARNKARLRLAEQGQLGQVATWNSNDPNYLKQVETTKDEQMRMENEQMKEYLSNTRRVLGDRINTIILLLENLKANL